MFRFAFRPSFVLLSSRNTQAGHVSGEISRRERAAEESYVARHESDILHDLTEKLRAKQLDEATVSFSMTFIFTKQIMKRTFI
jgi:hypothetical protein